MDLIVVDKIQPFSIVSKKNNQIIFKKKNFEINISIKPIDKSNHKSKTNENGFINKINYEFYWGTEGFFPVTEYDKIQIKSNQKTIDLPKKAFFNILTQYSRQQKYFMTKQQKLFI